ncbi:MAG: HEAT repeat domain-containing protein [Planctomycetota bacterium]
MANRSFRTYRSVIGLGLVLALVGLLAPTSHARQAADADPQQLLQDFNHFVFIAQPELAAANANALLALADAGELTPARFVGLIEDAPGLAVRFDDAYRRALLMPSLEGPAADLYNLYEQGRRQRARGPAEISANIEMLGGNMRGQFLARGRLTEAGEYAVPQLLEAMLRAQDPTVRAEAEQILKDLGRRAAVPLTASLRYLDPAGQEMVVRVLGSIPDAVSLPYLYELHATTNDAELRGQVERAVQTIDGQFVAGASVGGMYRQLAETYYNDRHMLSYAPFVGESHQLLWDWIPGLGLNPTAIYSSLFNEAMTMRLAQRALELDPRDEAALSLWLTANFSREIQQPEGYENPAYPAALQSAEYYAVAAGSTSAQRVLARALMDRETMIARRAIAALDRTAGGASLWRGLGEQRPLVEALGYPDRRVQYEAALTLAKAQPSQAFPDSDRVVPILASLIRDATKRFAAVVATDVERQQILRSALEGAGYEVIAPARTLELARESMVQYPGIDLIVIEQPTDATLETLASIRSDSLMRAAPVVALLPANDVNTYRARFADDHLTRLSRTGVSSRELASAVENLTLSATGPAVSAADGRTYALQSLDSLRGLAIGRNSVLSVDDASVALIAALREAQGDVQVEIADVLSHVRLRRAQEALMDEAERASGQRRVELLGYVTDSVKRFGNLLTSGQANWLIELATSGTGEEAVAAAALVGALNLPNADLVPLIIGGT